MSTRQSDIRRSGLIRLRTMIALRWMAIIGQLMALWVAQTYFEIALEMLLCLSVVAVSVVLNLIATFLFPQTTRLDETKNLILLFFDVLQLGVLLALTGGLNNPFALLLLGPVSISAAILSTRSSVILGGAALISVALISQFYIPLRFSDGRVISLPDLYVFGSAMALVIAICFIGLYSRWVAAEINSMSDALEATQLALLREQKLTDLGGIVAAAAHELGTPLATIKLASSELIEDLGDQSELRDDASLIRDQADRCSKILKNMGRAIKTDPHLDEVPIISLAQEAAAPHMDRGKKISFLIDPGSGREADQPQIKRKSEIIHGLRNLIQNAVDFADHEVIVEASWDERNIALQILDDGPGFPPSLMSRLGDPFLRRRRHGQDLGERPEYEGMGLGLFIAKTLLERSGATLTLYNASDDITQTQTDPDAAGAVAKLVWPREPKLMRR